MQPSPSWSGGWNRNHDEWTGWPQQSLERNGRRATVTLWQISYVKQIFLRTACTIHWIIGIMHLSLAGHCFRIGFKSWRYLETVCITIDYLGRRSLWTNWPSWSRRNNWWNLLSMKDGLLNQRWRQSWNGPSPVLSHLLVNWNGYYIYIFWGFQKIKLNSTFYNKHRTPFETCIKSWHRFHFLYVVLCLPYVFLIGYHRIS